MYTRYLRPFLITTTCLSLTAAASAQQRTPDHTDLQAQIKAMQAELAQLKARQNAEWLSGRRAEEIKGLVHEVLQDAETRASLLAEGATAGIDDKGKIFLKSADGSFKMNLAGQIQVRYIYNHEDGRGVGGGAGSDKEVESGFQLRRVKLALTGHIGDPKLTYGFGVLTDRNTGSGGGNLSTEFAYIGYKFDNDLSIQGGVFKLPFARQELVSAKSQVAADRSIVTEYFTLNYAEQIQLGWGNDIVKLAGAISDGANNDFTDYKNDQARNFALTGRADVKLAGEWSQMKDELAWNGEGLAAFVGAAFHYEQNSNKAVAGNNPDDYFAWTIDALVEMNNLGLTAAIFGASDSNNAGGPADRDPLGFYAQGAYNIDNRWAPFVRYEWLDDDTAGAEAIQAVTAGVNYFLKKHNAKLTADVVYIFAGDDPTTLGSLAGSELSTGLGLDSGKTDAEDQIALRLQLQLLF